MHFCPKCDNMMHVRISVGEAEEADESASGDPQGAMAYVCPHCGETKEHGDGSEHQSLVYSKNYDIASTFIDAEIINEYTKYDPTLPTIDIIPCANERCLSNEDPDNNPRDIIYIRYNMSELKYVYMCRKCNTTWKSFHDAA